MKWYKSKIGWILVFIYIVLFPVLIILTYTRESYNPISEAFTYWTLPWIFLLFGPLMYVGYMQESVMQIVLGVLLYVALILPNIIILYLIGYGIEKLIKKRKQHPPNQEQNQPP